MTVGLVDEANVHNWDIVMDGPEGSPYVVCPIGLHLLYSYLIITESRGVNSNSSSHSLSNTHLNRLQSISRPAFGIPTSLSTSKEACALEF